MDFDSPSSTVFGPDIIPPKSIGIPSLIGFSMLFTVILRLRFYSSSIENRRSLFVGFFRNRI